MSTLGIDLGTGSVKVAVVDDDLNMRQQTEATYAVSSPRPGWAESNPHDWRRAVESCLAEIADHMAGRQIDAVGLCGQMHGVVLTDAQFQPLRPAILWADTRSALQARDMAAAFDDHRLAQLGSAAVAGFAATSLRWVAENEPAVFANMRYALQAKDWLRIVLGGRIATDSSDASGTLLSDVATGAWDDDALAWAGVQRDQLPDIMASDDEGGEIRIGKQGVPITVGAADTAAVLFSSGIQAGQGFIAVGTGAQVVRVLDRPELDPSLRTHTFARAGEPGSGWYRIGAVQNAGLALEVALRWLGADVAEAHAALDQGLSLHDPIFIPYLAGERTPFMDPNLRGSWLGLSLNTDRNAMLRSVLVGLAQATALAVEAVFPESDRTPLLILGGGTRDERFRALLADAVNRELLPTVVPAQGVVGAAQLAMGRDPAPPATRTHIAPRPDQVDLLREKRQAMVQAMHPA